MCDLAARVDACVGAPGYGEGGGLGQPQHPGQGVFQGSLYRPLPGLARPAGEPGPVVPDVQPDPDRRWPGRALRLPGRNPPDPTARNSALA